ncbi:ABC transporter permease [Bacillus kexueae]|uniref:ABC transporter permease n=1 Tax=Aeribacillus kexueae TaxID=2078952 RepID=UPI001FAF7D9C|nr:ABC transporter permease [Bacillus kexueae]
MINLIFNEMIKISRKRKLLIISAIVAVLVAMFTYAQFREIQRITERLGTTDWRAQLQQDIIDAENRLNSSSMSDEYKEYLRTLIDQQKFYLEQNINPQAPGAPTFIRIFLENAIDLFIPLLVMVIAADLVSSEASGGTIKLLLTRPVKRSRILLSKLLAMILSVSLIVWIVILLSYLISGIVLGYGGWNLPILSGFESVNGELSTQNVHLIPQWQYILMEAGLVWFVAIIVGSLTFMLSVIMRSTAAVMGIILASLISGVILSNTISSWESAKYLFMINLRLTDYLRGFAPPIEGMTLGFSISVLAAWGATAIFIAFYSFTRKDVY